MAFGTYRLVWQQLCSIALIHRVNTIRTSRAYSCVEQFLGLLPPTNGADNGDGTGDLITANKGSTTENLSIVRIDHNFSDSHSLFGRYMINDSSSVVPYFGTPPGTYVPGFPALHQSRNQYLTVRDRRSLGQEVFNELRLGINCTTASTSIVDTHPGLSISLVPGRPFGSVPRSSAIGKLGAVSDHRCEITGVKFRAGLLTIENMVARDGVEPPTPAFSGLRSTT